MGYTHYWRRQPEIDSDKFIAIVDDFKKLMPELEKYIQLADGSGKKPEPQVDYAVVMFNGYQHCGHAQNKEISIPWPSEKAGGVAQGFDDNQPSGQWSAGAVIDKRMCNGDCSYESLYFPKKLKPDEWDKPKDGKFFDFCKTAFRPYDLAVTAFLVIAKHHLGDDIKVTSDGEDVHWFDAKMMCQSILGYGLEYKITEGELVK